MAKPTAEHIAKLRENIKRAQAANPNNTILKGTKGRPKSIWNGPGKRPPGRPRKPPPVPTEEELEADINLKVNMEMRDVCELAELQVGDEEISIFIKQPLDYVKDLYRTVIDVNKLKGKVKILKAQFQKAYEGNSNLLMWLGKHYFGQKDGISASTFEPEFRTLTRALEKLEDGSQLLIEDTRDAIVTKATTSK